MESGLIYTIVVFITGVMLTIQLTPRTSIPTGEVATYTAALLAPVSVRQSIDMVSHLAFRR